MLRETNIGSSKSYLSIQHGKRPASLLVAALVSLAACASPAVSSAEAGTLSDNCPKFDHSHREFTKILKKHVKSGEVDYERLHSTGRAELQKYLTELESVCQGEYKSWTKKQKIAFWINTYNAYTITLVLDNYPLKSLRKIGVLPGAAWREKLIPFEKLRGKTISLGHVENKILRKRFNEPRIHFALVCASKSCPLLRNEAFLARDLDKQLEEQTRIFLRDTSKNRFDTGSKTLFLSKIFDWYKDDFLKSAPSVEMYVGPYLSKEAKTMISKGAVEVEYLSYDWSLNGR